MFISPAAVALLARDTAKSLKGYAAGREAGDVTLRSCLKSKWRLGAPALG
jgi:hypothetical protein